MPPGHLQGDIVGDRPKSQLTLLVLCTPFICAACQALQLQAPAALLAWQHQYAAVMLQAPHQPSAGQGSTWPSSWC